MKRLTKRLISMLLALVLCFQMLPLTALAALLDNDPAYNQEILDSLTEIVGSDDEAARYYAMLDQYGLLDEEGNLAESWEIWLDGEQVTLEDILALLEDPDCDLTKYVLVDGKAITLGEVQTILQIEEYITYLREKYFDGYQWTEAQQASLVSLLEQIEEEGIQLFSEEAADAVGVPAAGNGVFPFVTSYNDLSKYDGPEQIFDGDPNSKWYSTSGQSNTTEQPFPLWAQVELGTFVTVASYGIVTGDDSVYRDPSNWILYGSNDGETWTVMDEQSAADLPQDRKTEQRFPLTESHTFRYFRYEIYARRGTGTGYGVQLSELNFYDEGGNRIDLFAGAVGVSGVNHGARVSARIDRIDPVITTENDTPPTGNQAETATSLFDGTPTTKWYSSTVPTAQAPATITVELPAPITASSYGFVTANDMPDRDPLHWTLYGSENGSNWTELNGQFTSLSEARYTETKWNFTEPASFRWFKLEIFAPRNVPSTNQGVQLADLNFYDADGNRIELTRQIFTAELTGAEPGQQVSYQYELLSGAQPVNSWAGTETMTADETGTASVAHDLTGYLPTPSTAAGPLDSRRSTTDLTFFVKLNNLENALFDNGYPNTTVIGRSRSTVTADLMGRVQKALETRIHTFTGNGTYTLALTDENNTYAYGTALEWGLLNKLEFGIVGDDVIGQTGQELGDKSWYYYLGRVDYNVTTSDGQVLYKNAQWITPGTWYEDYQAWRGYELKWLPGSEAIVDPNYTLYNSYSPDVRGINATVTINGRWQPELYIFKWLFNLQEYPYTGVYGYELFQQEGPYILPDPPAYSSAHTVNITTGCSNKEARPWIYQGAMGSTTTTYSPGHRVPVRLLFNQPVQAPLTMVINGVQCPSLETEGYTNCFTFLYDVQEMEENTQLHFEGITTDPFGITNLVLEFDDYMATNPDPWIWGTNLSAPLLRDVITDVDVTLGDTEAEPALNVSLSIVDDEAMTLGFISEELAVPEGGTGYQTVNLMASIDGGETLYPLTLEGETATGGTLTATIPIPANLSTEEVLHVVELYHHGKLLVGEYGIAMQQPIAKVTAEDLTATITVTRRDGTAPYAFTMEADAAGSDYPSIYPSEGPQIKASFTLSEDCNATYMDTAKVSYFDAEGKLVDSTAHFAWRSSDPAIAAVDKNGYVTPTGSTGTVTISIVALNGGTEESGFAAKAATYTVQALTNEGQTPPTTAYDALRMGFRDEPFLTIPNNQMVGTDGQDATVFWSTNLYTIGGETEIKFTVTVTKDNETVYTGEVTGTAKKPVSKAVIPGEKLQYDYNANANNTYSITVNCAFPGNGKYPAEAYSAEATISLDALPAQVSLKQLERYYILDTFSTVPVNWTIQNLVNVGDADSDDVFKFQVTRNEQEVPTDVTLALTDGTANMTYDLPIANITGNDDPAGYRDVYTVTVQAKNGADSTWSYDSFLLYVYDAEALKIWINGEAVGGDHTMSNIPEISAMTQEQILALNRDIYLKDIITVNYGEYAWTEVADQIVWDADGSSATLNYQQGALYENIDAYTYTSYRPTSELALAGLIDGKTTITATHKLTGMGDTLNVEVETLKDKLYLFQCYPQTTTTLTYTNDSGETKTVTSDETGAAAIYEPSGITGKVYCKSTYQGITYLGTFYSSELKTGEGDWTKLERYPCNNLTLRRAAYAYLYLKQPTGVPASGNITFRGGVYVNGEYVRDARFQINGSETRLNGYEDNPITLPWDGKLTITMDVTEWGLENNELKASDDVKYVFQIEPGGDYFYPIIQTVDATLNHDSYVHSGSAVVSFRANSTNQQHPFIAEQTSTYSNYNRPASLLDHTGKVGPGSSLPEATIETVVMWWGKDMTGLNPSVQFAKADTTPLAGGTVENSIYPFSDITMTRYTIDLNEDTIGDILEVGQTIPIWLNYYQDGQGLSYQEEMPFQLCNMLDVEPVEESESLLSVLQNLGGFTSTNAANAQQDQSITDEFVNIALNLVASDSYTRGSDSMFNIQIAPTADPTKFLGLISVNVGDTGERDQITGLYEVENQTWDGGFEVSPGVNELLVLGKQRTPDYYIADMDSNIASAAAGKGSRDLSFGFGGYAESLIYFDAATSNWKIQILSGGFSASGGANYTWNWNTVVGIVPFTASLSIGGSVGISMDALTISYLDAKQDVHLDNDFLTELRIYLYLRFFAGVGFDYSVMAFKLGIFGQIDVNMQFQWLNRSYLKTAGNKNMADGGTDPVMNGQSIKIDGTIGLEFVVRVLFISYEKVLWSQTFSLLNRQYSDWNKIQSNWVANQKALQGAISELLNTGGMSVYNLNGQQMYALNLAPTVEDRSYLEGGVSLFALDDESALASLDNEHYPYANPVVSNDGQLVGYLSDMDSPDVTMTRAAYGVMTNGAYSASGKIDTTSEDEGYGDSQLALSGTQSFAAAAWTRQTVNLQKAAGAVLTAEDQMMMMNSTEVYAAIYENGAWTPVMLSQNNSAPDLAPVVAVNGSHALVAWRSVSASGNDENITSFDQKDSIVYKLYSDGRWSDLNTLYNGTSGAVKGMTAAMMADGTAAVAYTLDADGDDSTLRDKDIYYAVVGAKGEVVRNVRATNDSYLDENPQLTAVTFPADGNQQHFVLGWYTEQGVAVDSAVVLASGDAAVNQNSSETTSDIRLIDITATGTPGQLLPDSISQVADSEGVTITSNFRFTKSAASINDLSILWVERAEGTVQEVPEAATDAQSADAPLKAEKDVLKGVKFYTYGENSELIRFTGAIDVAEMGDGTLIDHFDAYVSNPAANEVKAVILGTTYGAGGTVTKTVTLADGTQAQIDVPSQSTAMYTATETYTDKIDVPAVLVDYDTVRRGANTEIMFTVANKGIHAINAVTITVGEKQTTFNNLNILPGSSLRLYADYTVPEDRVVDPTYTVQATFDLATGAEGTAAVIDTVTAPVYLALPDIKITKAEISREENGQRDIRILLSNGSDAALSNSDHQVKISFYTDATCETPLEELAPIYPNSAYFSMINEGGYSQVVTFDVKAYLATQELAEIPENGITIYMKAQVLDADGTILGEPVTSNNFASVVCENLQVRTGQDAIITSTLTRGDANCSVDVSIQNTRLSQTSTGNLIVTLYDSNGNQIAQQQGFHPEWGPGSNYGLMTLEGEEKARRNFQFSETEAVNAASVKVTYSDLILDQDIADLDSITFSAFPDITLESFTLQEDGTYLCEISRTCIERTIVQATAKSTSAKINDGSASHYETVHLDIGKSRDITLTVTSGDGRVTKTYILRLHNQQEAQTDFRIEGPDTATYGDEPITLTARGSLYDSDTRWKIISGEGLASLSPNSGSTTTLSILQPGTVVVQATSPGDYHTSDATATHTITIDKATVSSGSFTYTPPSNLVYSGAEKQALVSGKNDFDYGTITVRYYSDKDLTNVIEESVAAGTYYVGITTEGNGFYHAVEVPLYIGSFTITPKPVTVTADNQKIHIGSDLPDLTYTVEGLIGEDAINVQLHCDDNATATAGEKEIVITATDTSGNYAVTVRNGKLTVEDHAYETGTFHWESDLSSATVTATCHCDAAAEPIPCEITSVWDAKQNAVIVTATASMGDSTFRDTQKIELSRSGSTLTITNSVADEAASVANMLVMVAGYEDSGKMTGSQIIETVTGVTEIDLTVTGTLKVFFLRPGSYVPLVPCAELQ